MISSLVLDGERYWLMVEMDNEPSVATPWLYTVAGRPWKTQATVAETMDRLWRDTPDGIPGNRAVRKPQQRQAAHTHAGKEDH